MHTVLSHKGALGSNMEAIMDSHTKKRVHTSRWLPEIKKTQQKENQESTNL